MFTSFWRTRTHRSSKSRPRSGFRPRLEMLEDRLTPSGNTWMVTTITDSLSATANDGSLRGEILQADTTGDTIKFAPSLNGQTIKLAGSEILLDKSLTITGPGANLLTISGDNASRVLEITYGNTVSISGLTIAHGLVPSSQAGGGIFNDGTLLVSSSTFNNNSASYGGGLLNQGTATVTCSTFNDNLAADRGGGIFNVSGSGTTLVVRDCTFTRNTAAQAGGAVFNDTLGVLTIADSTISGNSAKNPFSGGGGVYIGYYAGFSVPATISGSIIAGNNASDDINSVPLDPASGFNFIGGDPRLAPLGNYGGSTQTMALLPGSPAIDAGDPSDQSPDQRNVGVQNGRRDIGAFESRGFTLSVTGGDNQSAGAGQVFAAPLQVTVKANAPNEPVAGGIVSFSPPASGASAVLSGGTATIDNNGQASVTATANNTIGTYAVTASTTGANSADFHLTNSPLTVTAGPSQNVNEGDLVSLPGAGFTFGGNASALKMTVDWGDGTSEPGNLVVGAGTGTVANTHRYADEGACTVTLALTDGNTTVHGSMTVKAADVAPVAAITGMTQPVAAFILRGQSLTFSGNFTYPGLKDPHTVTWDFGDGKTATTQYGPGGSLAFNVAHAYTAAGTYTVKLTVTDDDGGTSTVTKSMTVQSPAQATAILEGLVDNFTGLNLNLRHSLEVKLDAAIDSMNRGNTTAAANQMGAFENQVAALKQSGQVPAATADLWTVLADSIIAAL